MLKLKDYIILFGMIITLVAPVYGGLWLITTNHLYHMAQDLSHMKTEIKYIKEDVKILKQEN